MTATTETVPIPIATGLSRKIKRLVRCLRAEFDNKQVGHCVRVDHLTASEARTACKALHELCAKDNPVRIETFVLASDVKNTVVPDEFSLYADRAIELRNRKRASLCLFLPANLRDMTASSLGNAFAPFDMTAFLKDTVQVLINEIASTELKRDVQSVLRQLRGRASVPAEQEISYLSAVLDLPEAKTVGLELWRVGLVPDADGPHDSREWPHRLDLNRRCVDLLARPLRPQSSVAERVAGLKLKPDTIQIALSQFFLGKPLQFSTPWLEELATGKLQGVLTFDRWMFPENEPSKLESVMLDPFAKTCGMKNLETDQVPEFECGEKQKLTVRWKWQPGQVDNAARWKLALVPSENKYDADAVNGVDFPETIVKGSLKTAKLNMEIDLESTEIREVQIRIVALDEHDTEILGPDEITGEQIPIGNYSVPFYLIQKEGPPPSEEHLRRLETTRCLADALLKHALDARDVKGKKTTANVEAQPVDERDLLYLPFIVTDGASTAKTPVRIATTPFLRDLQRKILENPEMIGRFSIRARGAEALSADKATTQPFDVTPEITEAWNKFITARRSLFAATAKKRDRAEQGLIEILELTPTICANVVRYAQAYTDLLDKAATTEDPAALGLLLEVDTLALNLAQGRRAVVVLPTHPLRLLWYVSYARWIEATAEILRDRPKRERKALFDADNLRRVAPWNIPALLPPTKSSECSFAFADNLGLFHCVLLPLDARDPGAMLSEVAQALGFDGLTSDLTDARPETLAKEVKNYTELHPYVKTLRVNAVNAGSGEFLQTALRDALKIERRDDDSITDVGLKLDLVTHSEASVQIPAAGLDALRNGWHRDLRERGTPLLPSLQIARRPLSPHSLNSLPGEDAHLAIFQDYFKPTLGLTASLSLDENPETSAALFGLLTRFQSRFAPTYETAVWQRQVAFHGMEGVEKHPVRPDLGNVLVEAQAAYLHFCARLLGKGENGDQSPTLMVRVDSDSRAILDCLHDRADWVIALDRNFGVEYYDSPNCDMLDRAAERYLLDYAPEFLEGLGHRMVVTTGWQEEVVGVLGRAMTALGLARTATSTTELLTMLKMLSGRLAMRLIGDMEETRAKETVGLAVVVNYLMRRNELQNAIVIPVDAHQSLFIEAKKVLEADSASRCDMMIVRPQAKKIEIEFVEVKFRKSEDSLQVEADRIATQNKNTEQTIRGMFFSDPARLDAPILRCQFAAILRFYAERANRHGRISNEGVYAEMLTNIGRMEIGAVKMTARHTGYLVALSATTPKTFKSGETTIHLLTGANIDNETTFERSVRPDETNHEGNIAQPVTEPRANEDKLTSAPIAAANGAKQKVSEVKNVPNTAITISTLPVAEVKSEVLTDAPPDNTTVANKVRQPLVVPLGINAHTGEEISWIGATQGSPHLLVLGIPGQGKSWTTLRLVSEVAKQGVASLILDFHGQFAAEGGLGGSAHPRILDVAEGLPFSPFEARSYRGAAANYWKTNALQISEIFQYICKLGDMQRDLVYEAISGCYRDAGFANDELTEDAPPLEVPTVAQVFSRLQALEQIRRGAANTVARCRTLFEFDLFREDAQESLDYAAMQGRTTVLDLHNVGVETVQMAAGAFVLRKIYRDMFGWGEAQSIRLLIVLDEAHRLAKDITLPKLMKEGRKFGIAVLVASQGERDFHPDALQNAGTRILFRTNFPASRRIAGLVRPSHRIPDVAAALEKIGVGYALVQTVQMDTCAETEMYPYTE